MALQLESELAREESLDAAMKTLRYPFLCDPAQHRALGSGGRRAGGFWALPGLFACLVGWLLGAVVPHAQSGGRGSASPCTGLTRWLQRRPALYIITESCLFFDHKNLQLTLSPAGLAVRAELLRSRALFEDAWSHLGGPLRTSFVSSTR